MIYRSKSSKLSLAFELIDENSDGILTKRGLWRYFRSFLCVIFTITGAALDMTNDEMIQICDECAIKTSVLLLQTLPDAVTTCTFENLADWYTTGGYKSATWLELLDLSKWLLIKNSPSINAAGNYSIVCFPGHLCAHPFRSIVKGCSARKPLCGGGRSGDIPRRLAGGQSPVHHGVGHELRAGDRAASALPPTGASQHGAQTVGLPAGRYGQYPIVQPVHQGGSSWEQGEPEGREAIGRMSCSFPLFNSYLYCTCTLPVLYLNRRRSSCPRYPTRSPPYTSRTTTTARTKCPSPVWSQACACCAVAQKASN